MIRKTFTGVFAAAAASLAIAQAEDVIKPTVITGADKKADVFKNSNAEVESKTSQVDGEYTTEDFMPFTSSDEKLFIGMYRTDGHHRFEINDAYGVDEYMHFLKGGVTLTSSDGSVTEIKAGDSVIIPKEWTGVWESHGYEKIYVIYEVPSKDAAADKSE